MATPLEIQILLHYYSRVDKYAAGEPTHANSLAVREAHNKFVQYGLLEFENGKYERVEEALAVYAKALCAVPFPTQQWVLREKEKA